MRAFVDLVMAVARCVLLLVLWGNVSSALRPTCSRPRLASLRASASSATNDAVVTRTQRILEAVPIEVQAGGAGGATNAPSTWEALQRADTAWARLKQHGFSYSGPKFVSDMSGQPVPTMANVEETFDVVICGGTLGIFIATALAVNHNLKVAVIEQTPQLKGRAQEWNISLKELQDLVELGVFTQSEIDGAVEVAPGDKIARCADPSTLIATHFKAVRAGYNNAEVESDSGTSTAFGRNINTGGTGKQELWIDGVLNLGIRPDVAIQRARNRLEASPSGSKVFEGTSVKGVTVHSEAALIDTDRALLSARLVVDCMGHASPAVRQARNGQNPDGVCLVVGTCATGFGPHSPQNANLRPQARANEQGDIIYTNQDLHDEYDALQQHFWEAFPAGAGEDLRTTYLFTYVDAGTKRPSLTQMFENYWEQLKDYQGIDVDRPGFEPLRCLFAFFPTFRGSPLKSPWPRVLHCGDASGIQSPLSFGGFGALTRHLGRLTDAIGDAVELDLLDKHSLDAINPYMPNLAATWMFQRSMSTRSHDMLPSPDFVNRLLRTNFDIMNDLGDEVMLPFLQDVVQFEPLLRTLGTATVRDPLFIPQILLHVGAASIIEWIGHFSMMGLYTVLHHAAGTSILDGSASWMTSLPVSSQYRWRRRAEAWKFGAGLDYQLASTNEQPPR